MDRNVLQGYALRLLVKNRKLICEWATGCGKSAVAVKFIKSNNWLETLIVVPEQNNIQNWLDEFNKFNVPVDNVTIICYASLHKYINTKWDFIVLDEMPHIDTMKRTAILNTMCSDYVLALGAVIDEEEEASLKSVFGEFEKSIVSLHKAIEWGIIPSPRINILHLQLDNTIRKHWMSGKQLTDKEYYDALKQKIDKAVDDYNNKPNHWTKQTMFRLGSQRKRFLGSLKESKLKDICSRLDSKQKRFLCFCSSIAQAESIGKDRAFTSKTPASMNLLDKFNNKEINSLYVVSKLIEGQNLNDIECGVIGQLGGTDRITVQSIGRVLRAKDPVVYVLVFDDTKDDSFLKTLTYNIPEDYIKHYNF